MPIFLVARLRDSAQTVPYLCSPIADCGRLTACSEETQRRNSRILATHLLSC